MSPLFAALLLFQQQGGRTTPPSGDTVGYWQQGIAYTIVATLDERQARIHARAQLRYVNNSPDTLREMYFHQYLNAFRPASKWSDADTREGRERFQHLQEPDYGYERFTALPVFGGVAVRPEYSGAPDSTVVHFPLPRALAPHDSIDIALEWDARPSTVPRRQARRGRTWDLAQWYPKVAVYDRAGWEENPFVPAGELYGEYGTYDATLVVPNDQVVVATGVPVAGDPGWARVQRSGTLRLGENTYRNVPAPPPADVPDGYRRVRFYARDVHHFAWSASPDYRYEGALLVRHNPPAHFETWDTVSIHALYKPGDDTTWGGGRATNRTLTTFRWLESIYGPFGWPAFSNVHRIEGGGTEFPMMIMDGSASLGLILHEAGHNYTYGILGNNEWRSGWMDEGLTSYQTSWALGQTPQERVRSGLVPPPPRLPEGYRVNATTIPPAQRENLELWQLDLLGLDQPIGTPAYAFRDFDVYNQMIYSRAELMYSHLRDAVGDTAFRGFLHDYYDRWALKHVDELAMRSSAERASGQDLRWFFDEWVHDTGLLDYALVGATPAQREDGQWVTRAVIEQRGEYHHPMPVGVFTSAGWTLGRGNAHDRVQTVEIVTRERPTAVQIDPFHFTMDWDRRNDVLGTSIAGIRQPRFVYAWPFLDQSDRDHTIVALAPQLWYGSALGGVVGARAHTSYLSLVDRFDAGAGFSLRQPWDQSGTRGGTFSRMQLWLRADDPYPPGVSRPLVGHHFSIAFLDGILKLGWRKRWNLSPFVFSNGPRIDAVLFATGAYPTDHTTLPEQWEYAKTTELGGSLAARSRTEEDSSYWRGSGDLSVGLAGGQTFTSQRAQAYARLLLSGTRAQSLRDAGQRLILRGFAGIAPQAPLQRQIFASSDDPFATFDNNWWRPLGGALKQEHINYVPFGGAGLRGYSPYLAFRHVVAANGELTQRAFNLRGPIRRTALWLSLFGDVGAQVTTNQGMPPTASGNSIAAGNIGSFGDAGVGASVRGRIYDRAVTLRLDLPLLVKQPALAGGAGLGGKNPGSLAFRWVFSLNDFR